MQRIVINKCYGGFGISHAAVLRYAEIKGIDIHFRVDDISAKYGMSEPDDPRSLVHYYTSPAMNDESYFTERDIARDDPALIQVLEEMGESANGRYAELEVVDIPDGVEYEIEEYDGTEWIAEKHRTWA